MATPKVPTKQFKTVFAWLGWVVVYTALIAAAAFYYGTRYENSLHTDKQAAVNAALASYEKVTTSK